MQPRDHHYRFAHRLLPSAAFESPDKLFTELTGPMSEGFLMYLWQEAGKGCAEQLKPTDVGQRPGSTMPEVMSLTVLSVDEIGGWQIITLGMPPTAAQGEAMFIAIARSAFGLRYFVYEQASTPGSGNFAEWRQDSSRVAYGPQPGVTPGDFARAIATELGVAGGQPASGPTAGGMFAGFPSSGGPAFGAGPQLGGAQPLVSPDAATKIAAIASPLALLLLVRGLYPAAMWLFWMVAPRVVHDFSLLDLISDVGVLLRQGLTLAAMLVLLVWLYRVFDGLRGKTKYSPGMAVGGWFIPFANFALPMLVMQDAWKATHRGQPDSRVTLWWVCFLVNAGMEVAWRMEVLGFSGLLSLVSVAVSVGAYMLLLPLVREITQRASG